MHQDPVLVDFSGRVLATDYLMRWLSLGIYRLVLGGEQEVFFLVLQLLITAISIAYALYRDAKFRMYLEQKNITLTDWATFLDYIRQGVFGIPIYSVIGSSFSVIVRLFYIFTFSYMFINVFFDVDMFLAADWNVPDQRRTYFIGGTIICLFVYGIYVYILSTFSAPTVQESSFLFTRPIAATEPKTNETAPADRSGLRTNREPELPPKAEKMLATGNVDANDTLIVQIEGNLKNLQTRVDAYVLESVMFGALTFSGFLTILADGIERKAIMKFFGLSLKSVLKDMLILDFKNPIENGTSIIFSDDYLVIWIMFETLLCSMFFLFVIASRLRFSRIVERTDNAIRLARSYNDKEEEIYLLHIQFENIPRFKQRLEFLGMRIEQQVRIATELLKEVGPVVYYMSLFRNLGVMGFLAIIVTSLLFFSNVIAGLVAFLAVMVYVSKEIDDWYRRRRLEQIEHSHHHPHE
jgi:hypothetical protein